MITVPIRDVVIGSGRPKICIPIVGRNREDILDMAARCRAAGADVAEWRADWFEFASDHDAVRNILRHLREALGDMPLLFTFRTAREGGEGDLAPDAYLALNKFAIQTGCIDLVDVELFAGETIVRDVVHTAHRYFIKVVASSHDFQATPAHEEIVSRLIRMQKIGADILKIAVMPKNRQDVLTLLGATADMYENHADKPLITMSMGPLGLVSRLAGESFGSALSFGSAGKASAPGQIDSLELLKALEIIHNAL